LIILSDGFLREFDIVQLEAELASIEAQINGPNAWWEFNMLYEYKDVVKQIIKEKTMVIGQETDAAMNADGARFITKHSAVEKHISWFTNKAWPNIAAAAKRGEFFTYLEVCNDDVATVTILLDQKGFHTRYTHAERQTTATITVSWYDE
jgi:hypothetical protein